jgi:hypothetical protein
LISEAVDHALICLLHISSLRFSVKGDSIGNGHIITAPPSEIELMFRGAVFCLQLRGSGSTSWVTAEEMRQFVAYLLSGVNSLASLDDVFFIAEVHKFGAVLRRTTEHRIGRTRPKCFVSDVAGIAATSKSFGSMDSVSISVGRFGCSFKPPGWQALLDPAGSSSLKVLCAANIG